MTEDTRRALEIIAPMAKELDIEVKTQGSYGNYLVCNGQYIGIADNSTFATIMEFIGYVFATVYKHNVFDTHGETLPPKVLNRVKKYWVNKKTWTETDELMEKWRNARAQTEKLMEPPKVKIVEDDEP